MTWRQGNKHADQLGDLWVVLPTQALHAINGVGRSPIPDHEPEAQVVTSNRRDLFKILGAGAVGAAGASLLKAVPAGAATGDPVLAGDQTNAEATTVLYADGATPYTHGLLAVTDTPFDDFPQDVPQAAVLGFTSTDDGTGVAGYGIGDGGVGMYGQGSVGVQGFTDDAINQGFLGWVGNGENGPFGVYGFGTVGVYGTSQDSFGVQGETSAASAAGVRGDDSSKAGGVGVYGDSTNGTGIQAVTTAVANTNPALKATSGGKGPAVIATTTTNATGAAVHASSGSSAPAVVATGEVVAANGGTVPVAGNGAALTVQGVASFSRSGVATIAAAATSVVMSVPGGLAATSHVLAMVQTNSTVWVKAVVPSTATGKITIYLNAAPSTAITVAWFVFG